MPSRFQPIFSEVAAKNGSRAIRLGKRRTTAAGGSMDAVAAYVREARAFERNAVRGLR